MFSIYSIKFRIFNWDSSHGCDRYGRVRQTKALRVAWTSRLRTDPSCAIGEPVAFLRLRWRHPLAPPWFFLLFLALAPVVLAAGPQGFDTVVIDPGHGGYDPGGILGLRTRPMEKEATLDVALRLAKVLQARGLRVILTRRRDEYVTLGARGAAGDRLGGRAIFVSIHFNAALRAGASGIETYYYRGDSLGLATRAHREVTAAAGTEDRRVHRRGFYVIRRAAIPAILCECGFLTNPEEDRAIGRGDYRQRLAGAIAAGILAQRRSGDPPGLQAPPFESGVRRVPRHARSTRTHRGKSSRHRHR